MRSNQSDFINSFKTNFDNNYNINNNNNNNNNNINLGTLIKKPYNDEYKRFLQKNGKKFFNTMNINNT
jgi:hypothetical protein